MRSVIPKAFPEQMLRAVGLKPDSAPLKDLFHLLLVERRALSLPFWRNLVS